MTIRAADYHWSRKLNTVMVAACPFPAKHASPVSIRDISENK